MAHSSRAPVDLLASIAMIRSVSSAVAVAMGERMALTNERIAILEAQHRALNEKTDTHLDDCAQKWSEAKNESRSLRKHVDERLDQIERKREQQHRANTGLLMGILFAMLTGFATVIGETVLHVK